MMPEKASNIEKQFNEADDDSWWHCLSPDCNCAYQKKECSTPGICPYCQSADYQAKPWESAMLDNPNFPDIPESGQIYRPNIG
jgi:hypothetical protein